MDSIVIGGFWALVIMCVIGCLSVFVLLMTLMAEYGPWFMLLIFMWVAFSAQPNKRPWHPFTESPSSWS